MLNDLIEMSKIKEGNIKAFESVFRKYYSPLCLYSASITGQMNVAEEIVQEIFYIFWKEKDNLHIVYSVKSYLYTAVRNQSIQYCHHLEVRNRYRQHILAAQVDSDNPYDWIEYKELQELIERTLKKLPERSYHIFSMHRTEGKKYAEIASLLSISIKTVEAEMTKTLKLLRKEIDKYIQTT